MSLDLYLACPTCHHAPHETFNITHNAHRICAEAGTDPWEWEGRTGASVVGELDTAIAALSERPEHFQQWAPSNGWGTVSGTSRFLRDIRGYLHEMAHEHPERLSWTWRVCR